jgi:hypothetical protein
LPWVLHTTLGRFGGNYKVVTAGHSRPKDGVASWPGFVPAIHVLLLKKDVDARDERGHDVE